MEGFSAIFRLDRDAKGEGKGAGGGEGGHIICERGYTL